MTTRTNMKRVDDEVHVLGFWIYLMSDLVIFGVLFACYAVLHGSTFGGPTADKLFSLPSALTETIILLSSSFTCGLALIAAQARKEGWTIAWLGATFVLGATFLTLELSEFARFVAAGASWRTSAFLSSFFALVGTHGLHISVGLLWILVMMAQIKMLGLTPGVNSKLYRFALFWHFLDIVWIFIFTAVYLMGVM